MASARHDPANAGTDILAGEAWTALEGLLAGTLLRPGAGGYEDARRLWNGLVNRRPAAIARCASAGDVAAAVRFAAERGIDLAVRSGGHSISGASSCDGGLMIDLSQMRRVQVDAERRIARAQPGAQLADIDRATQAHGLATTMGVISDTGIGGLALGGGLGKLCRLHGLTCDNLVSAELVLADGSIVRASDRDDRDLFWAIRGGGGNFGIATELEFRLHPLGPVVLGGMLVWDWPSAPAAMRHYARFCAAAPEAADGMAVIMKTPEGAPVFAVLAFHAGDLATAERDLRTLRTGGPAPAQDLVQPVAYADLQASADGAFPRGRRYYWKSHFLPGLPDGAVDVLLDAFARVPSPLSMIALQQTGGAIARVPPEATAYANRDAAFDCIPISAWEDPADDAAQIAWVRGLWETMRPFATGGVYVNNLGDEGDDRIRAAYRGNYARLSTLKQRYDPGNLFRLNQNIRPRA